MTSVMTSDPPAVGFIGLGRMGSLLAGHLVDWPGGLVVHDVRSAAAQTLRARGVAIAPDAAAVAADSDIVSVMVLDDEQVRTVVGDLLPAARPGTIVALHSTIGPQTAVELADRADDVGVTVLDAPVSGGAVGAAAGRLAVMVGGDRRGYERCRDVFGRWAELVVHVGPVGAGTQAKLARNLLAFTGYAAAAEAQRLAEAAGVDLRKLAGVVRHTDALTGGVGSIMLRDTTAPLSPDDPLRPVLMHACALGDKDLALALELGASLGVDLPFARLARDRLAEGLGLQPEGA
jgi:3-hydroxyisobutyrate dehydrogenase-like beta-hydroxyacid dehydrogenase